LISPGSSSSGVFSHEKIDYQRPPPGKTQKGILYG
jgi:hypothetical protein